MNDLARTKKEAALGVAQLGTPILLKWIDFNGATVDPLSGGYIGGTPVTRQRKSKALLHFITASMQVRQYAEVEVGDCIADFAPDTDLDGFAELRFVIEGREWVQKSVGGKLAEIWDAVVGGERIFRTVLLRKAT